MFDGLWPGFDDREVPITSITNGVHAPTWVDRRVFELAEKHLGTPSWSTDANAWERIGGSPAPRSGRPRASCARSWSRGPPAGALVVGQARCEPAPSWAGWTTSSTPTS